MDHSRACPHVLRGGTMTKEQALLVIQAATYVYHNTPLNDPDREKLKEAIIALIMEYVD